jgi:hypothetical protein
MRHAAVHGLVALEAPAVERLELETTPRAETVASFVLTRAAERAWESLNRHLAEPAGALFWIGGPPGCGKTHFLNYVIALSSRAGALEADASRRVVCGFEVAGKARTPDLEAYVLNVLGGQLGEQQQTLALWREMRGAAALNVALEQTRRMGIRALTLAIDFAAADANSITGYFATLAEVAASSRHLKFTVIAAGRGKAPEPAVPVEVGPADATEEIVIMVRRARRIAEGAEHLVDEFYRGIDTGGLDALSIFPFHPVAARALRVLAYPPGTISTMARLAREAVAAALDDGVLAGGQLIYPSDLMASLIIARRLEARLGEGGRAAFRIATGALGHFHSNERELARQIIATLVIDHICGGGALDPTVLEGRVPMLASADEAWTSPLVTELLRKLAAATGGVIRFESDGARFDPAAAGTPEVAAFNAALGIIRRFDPPLTAPRDLPEMEMKLLRLADAMALAVESASRTREVLTGVLAGAHLQLPPEHERTIADYIALAEGGPAALLKRGGDPAERERAAAVISAYEGLAAAAAVAPRMRAMREYLETSGLRVSYDEDLARDSRMVALETECQLLAAELAPRLLAGAPRNLDALEARFQKFKWTYVQLYRAAHAQWRAEMERLALMADDARRHLDALRRLNVITLLGPPAGEELAPRVAELARQVVRCDFDGPLQPEVAPRCTHCSYLLGTPSPRAGLEDVLERLRRALHVKLAALSQSAIARIIRQHDRAHRLEGFLKITQAAQTDALVRVLDERLARYLAQLLDESLAGASEEPAQERLVKPLDRQRLTSSGPRSALRNSDRTRKVPPRGDRS